VAALDAAPRPPTNKLLLLKALIDAAWVRVVELSTHKNSTWTTKFVCMIAARALLADNDNGEGGGPLLVGSDAGDEDAILREQTAHLKLKKDVKVVDKAKQNFMKGVEGMQQDGFLRHTPVGAVANMLEKAFGLVPVVAQQPSTKKQVAASASLLPAAAQAAAPRSMRSSDGGAFFCGGGGGGRPLYDASRSSRSSDGAFFAPRPSGGVPLACRPPLRVSRSSGGFIPSPSARASGGAAVAMMVPGGAAQLPAAVCRAASSLKPRSSAGASFIPAARFAMMHL
jgi:hypothetical protein